MDLEIASSDEALAQHQCCGGACRAVAVEQAQASMKDEDAV